MRLDEALNTLQKAGLVVEAKASKIITKQQFLANVLDGLPYDGEIDYDEVARFKDNKDAVDSKQGFNESFSTSKIESEILDLVKEKMPGQEIVKSYTAGDSKNPEKVYVSLHDTKKDINWKFVIEFDEDIFELSIENRTVWYDLPVTKLLEHYIDAVKMEYYQWTHLKNEATQVLEDKTQTIVNQRNFLDTYEMTFKDWCNEIDKELLKYDMDLETLKKKDIFVENELDRFFDSGRDPKSVAYKLFRWYR